MLPLRHVGSKRWEATESTHSSCCHPRGTEKTICEDCGNLFRKVRSQDYGDDGLIPPPWVTHPPARLSKPGVLESPGNLPFTGAFFYAGTAGRVYRVVFWFRNILMPLILR
jgi:hypothetical protein